MTNKLDVVGPEEAATAAVLVCALVSIPLMLPDNVTAVCAGCSRMVQHRPNVPKEPRKLCSDCAMPIMRSASARNDLHVMMVPETYVMWRGSK